MAYVNSVQELEYMVSAPALDSFKILWQKRKEEAYAEQFELLTSMLFSASVYKRKTYIFFPKSKYN